MEELKKQKRHLKQANLITIERKNKQVSEQFRSIRSNINFASIDTELRSLVISSASSGDGKTITAANLAIVFSQEGKRVLLVDADMRKPDIHHIFQLPNYSGLSNYLVGQIGIEEAIKKTYLTNLDITTSGSIPPNPSELIASNQMKRFMEDAMAKYDVVIFDTPPILVVTDATLIANQCDGTVIVVRAKKNDLKDVLKVKEQLSFADANLIGAILNGKKQYKDSSYYY